MYCTKPLYLRSLRPRIFALTVFLVLLGISSGSSLRAQCMGNLTLTGQDEVNGFRQTFPACTEWTGSITVVGPVIDSLTALRGLTSISGTLHLQELQVSAIDDLTDLDTVGTLALQRIFDLTSLLPVSRIKTAGLRLTGNPLLNNLLGGQHLRSLPEGLQVSANTRLVSLRGLDSLRYIGDELSIQGNDTLQTIEALDSLVLTNTSTDVSIINNRQLASLEGLEGLRDVRGSVVVSSCPRVEDLEPLRNLTRATRGVTISNLPLLTNLTGLRSLQSTSNTLTLSSMPRVADLRGLERLVQVGNNMIVSNMRGLKTLQGITSLRQIGGSLGLIALDSLTSLRGVEQLDTIGGLSIASSPRIEGLTNLDDDLHIEASLLLQGNDELRTCAVPPICAFIARFPDQATVEENEVGCLDLAELTSRCEPIITEEQNAGTAKLAVVIDAHQRLQVVNVEPWHLSSTVRVYRADGTLAVAGELSTAGSMELSPLAAGVYIVHVVSAQRAASAQVWIR